MTIWWSQYMFFSSGTCLFLLLHACWVASLRSSSSVSSSAHASRAFDTRPWETSFAFVVTRRSYLAIGLWRLGDERAYILWRQWPMYGWSLLLAESSLACFVRIFSTKGHVLSSPHMLDKKPFWPRKRVSQWMEDTEVEVGLADKGRKIEGIFPSFPTWRFPICSPWGRDTKGGGWDVKRHFPDYLRHLFFFLLIFCPTCFSLFLLLCDISFFVCEGKKREHQRWW